jgi:hypothetical protein
MSKSPEPEQRPADPWTGPAKWVVIGVVAITFMVMFRSELASLLGRAEEVNVSADSGVTLKLRTVATPLGETVLSNTGTELTQPNAQGKPVPLPESALAQYTDPLYGYSLAWPQNGNWQRDDSLTQGYGPALVLRHRQSHGNFTPNVNVTMEQVGGVTIDDWMRAGNASLAAAGFQLVSLETDPATQSGVRVMRHTGVDGVLYQIQRVVLHNGVAFVVTASKLEQIDAPGVYEQLRQILNSFRVG